MSVLVLFSVLFLIVGCTQAGTPASSTAATESGTDSLSESVTVTITSAGFEPNEVTIPVGGTVTWSNTDSVGHWPASAMHPTHTAYPGSGIEKCGTEEQAGIFDVCKDLAQGESWSFTFTEQGSWNYHDHTVLGKYGKVIVQ